MQATWTDLFVLLIVLAGIVLLLRTKPPRVMHFLPEPSDYDMVHIVGAESVTRDHVAALVCPHVAIVRYERADYRPVEQGMADGDYYFGTCCADCGLILNERKGS